MAFCFIDTCRPVTTYHLYCSSIRLTYLYSPCGRVQSSLLTTHGTRIIKRKLVIDTGDQIHFKKRKLHFPLHLWNLYFLPRVCCAVIDTLRFSLALRKMISRSLNLLTEDQFWQKFKNLLLLQFFDSMTTHNIRQIIWWSNFGRMFLLSSIFVAMWLTWLVFQSWVQPLTAHLYLLITSPRVATNTKQTVQIEEKNWPVPNLCHSFATQFKKCQFDTVLFSGMS